VKRNGIVSICCKKEENRRVANACEGVEASFQWGQGLSIDEQRGEMRSTEEWQRNHLLLSRMYN
jgi:hypothetical protein